MIFTTCTLSEGIELASSRDSSSEKAVLPAAVDIDPDHVATGTDPARVGRADSVRIIRSDEDIVVAAHEESVPPKRGI